jgi:hypothetical protein
MNSGLSPGDPTLVAAFRSALMHQGAIALLMLALVWLLWAAGSARRALPPVPAGTQVLAPGSGGSYDALAVAGSRLTVWRLAHGAWAKVQQVTVPVQYGSSG